MVAVAAVCCALEATAAAAQEAGTVTLGQIQLRDDKFSPFREYTTGQVATRSGQNVLGVEFLGRIDRQSGLVPILLKVEFGYLSSRKRSYEVARNSRAEPLPFTKVASNRRCEFGATDCVHSEAFTVEIPQAELRQAGPEGYQLKVFARSGPGVTVGLPKATIVAMLAKIDADRSAKAKPGPAKAK
jgi:hypothetical protein